MKRKDLKTLIIVTLALLFSLLESKGIINLDREDIIESKDKIFVSRVIDGDTIELNTGEKLRYIGINTPELKRGHESECFAIKAAEFNKKLVEGKKVRLEKDVSDKDKFGRLLRYVYVEHESTTSAILVNDYLVRNGYAIISTYPPDIKYIDTLLLAQQEARTNNRGVWDECD